jgi:hypothetical protein
MLFFFAGQIPVIVFFLVISITEIAGSEKMDGWIMDHLVGESG